MDRHDDGGKLARLGISRRLFDRSLWRDGREACGDRGRVGSFRGERDSVAFPGELGLRGETSGLDIRGVDVGEWAGRLLRNGIEEEDRLASCLCGWSGGCCGADLDLAFGSLDALRRRRIVARTNLGALCGENGSGGALMRDLWLQRRERLFHARGIRRLCAKRRR